MQGPHCQEVFGVAYKNRSRSPKCEFVKDPLVLQRCHGSVPLLCEFEQQYTVS